jgi:3-dehydroquinate synthase
MRRVTVAVGPPYDVIVGSGALGDLAEIVADYRRVVTVTQTAIAELYGSTLTGGPRSAAGPWVEVMGDGEPAKSFATVESLCRAFAAGGLLRGDVVVALGGGVVGDTAGFAAAVYHRGVDVIQVPTTLLAQVDSAVGGKTAVNLPEGKNLVGAFHQPVAVVADTATLATLPDAEFRCGLGEVAKYALMPEGGALVEILRFGIDRVLARDPETLAELVEVCVAIKAGVVAADPHEHTGARATLNYGHTFAHALETSSHAGGPGPGEQAPPLAHGEAVAIGLVFDAHLAHALERVGLDVVDQVHGVVAGLGLPVTVPTEVGRDELLAVMRRDKKAVGGLTFVLPGPDGLTVVDDPPPGALDAAFRSVGVA